MKPVRPTPEIKTVPSDPFSAHPELRDKIKDPLTSFFRTFSAESAFAERPELSWVLEELHSDEKREELRVNALNGRFDDDLWVFAYGSLMWDPAFRFADVRRATLPGYARRFLLKDIYGGRGTKEKPGLMAGLDQGHSCEGLAFRIEKHHIETETEVLWRREMIGPGYIPTFVPVQIDSHEIEALTFVADHSADGIEADLPHEEQIRFIAHGSGFLGTSKEYLENIVAQFAVLGIVDKDCSALLADVERHMQSLPPKST
ncbi:MAG: gamma-glutamylcyclotransferase [Marinosulfonomonas sp.]